METALKLNLPSPLQPFSIQAAERAGVQCLVKREDLIHPQLSGNKWRKLKYNLLRMQSLGQKRLLTFGGAYSNHLYATAYAVHTLGLEGIAIIRGERIEPLNNTLSFVEACGMKTVFISRSEYRRRRESAFIEELRQKYGPFYLVPEGGTNQLAIEGVEEMVFEALRQIKSAHTTLPAGADSPQPAHWAVACGTGGTLAGIIAGLAKAGKTEVEVLGFSALKGDFLQAEVSKLLDQYFGPSMPKLPGWKIFTDYHFGGFARNKPELQEFIDHFTATTGIPTEHVYTGKMFYGLNELLKQNYFPAGSSVLAVHTGGMRVC